MKMFICIVGFVCLMLTSPVIAAPGGHGGPGGRGFHGGHSMGRPMGGMHRPGGPGMRPPMVRPMHPHMVGRPGSHIGHVRPLPPPPPPVYIRPYRPPIVRPYYYPVYYPTYYRPTTYSTYYYFPYTNYMTQEPGVTPVAAEVSSVVVKDDYAAINTAANVVNTAANVASTIKYLSW